jgi:uncharacterized membrane protein YesL
VTGRRGSATIGAHLSTELTRTARKSFWNAYDHLGGCVLLNLLWTLLSLPWLALTLALIALGWSQMVAGHGLFAVMLAGTGLLQILLSPVSAALWTVTARWSDYRAAPVRDFFPALGRYFGRALVVWLIFSSAAFLLSINVYFYGALLSSVPFIGALVGGLMVWAYLAVTLMGLYALPLLVQQDLSVRLVARDSFLLVLDNLLYSLVLVLAIGLVVVLGLVSGAGFFVLAVSLAAVIANTGLRELLRKYQAAGEDPREKRKPRTWKEIYADRERAREDAEEETRGWRDLWKPWEDR